MSDPAQQDPHLVDAAAAPDAFEPGSVYVLSDTRFEGNQTKVGGDELPREPLLADRISPRFLRHVAAECGIRLGPSFAAGNAGSCGLGQVCSGAPTNMCVTCSDTSPMGTSSRTPW